LKVIALIVESVELFICDSSIPDNASDNDIILKRRVNTNAENRRTSGATHSSAISKNTTAVITPTTACDTSTPKLQDKLLSSYKSFEFILLLIMLQEHVKLVPFDPIEESVGNKKRSEVGKVRTIQNLHSR
jgi:hypothetical protein